MPRGAQAHITHHQFESSWLSLLPIAGLPDSPVQAHAVQCIAVGCNCLPGNATARSCEIRGGRKAGEEGEGPWKGQRYPDFPYRHGPVLLLPWGVTSWPSPALISPFSRAVSKNHLAGSLLGVTCRKPQPASKYSTNYREVRIAKKYQTLFEWGQAPALCLNFVRILTSTCPSNSKQVPEDMIASDDSIVITNSYYYALLASEA